MTAPRNSGLTPLLRAKLRPPVVGAHYVRRPRLLELLDDVANGPLTVVVAPAGAGKTSVVAGWTAERSAMPIAWLSLDDGDRDGAQFWSGVIAAMETVKPGCGEAASSLLRRPGPVSDAVGQLLVDLESGDSSPAVLVIDDVHLVDDDDDIADSLAFFEHHLPAWLHLVLVSRRTPKLRLDRLRARGQVGELRFDELRFSPGEAKELLRRLAPSLSEEGVDLATVRADGWAASLQLAALAARSRRAQDALEALSIDDGDLVHDYVLARGAGGGSSRDGRDPVGARRRRPT